MPVPRRVAERFGPAVKKYQAILTQQKARDVSEADTVTVVKDLLTDLFGYDKYAELTSEHSIRGTYCDLAIRIDGRLAILIEVKSIDTDLKDAHVKQAVDYAANQGCEWVALTNGVVWHLYHVIFKKPIDKTLIASFDLLSVNPKSDADAERLYLLTREGFTRSALAEFRDRKEATSRFMLAAVVLSEPVISAVRRELRRVSEVLIDPEAIEKMLRDDVLKRDTIEGDEAEAASRRVQRKAERSIRRSAVEETKGANPTTPAKSSSSSVVPS